MKHTHKRRPLKLNQGVHKVSIATADRTFLEAPPTGPRDPTPQFSLKKRSKRLHKIEISVCVWVWVHSPLL